jgi:hypothetical protein
MKDGVAPAGTNTGAGAGSGEGSCKPAGVRAVPRLQAAQALQRWAVSDACSSQCAPPAAVSEAATSGWWWATTGAGVPGGWQCMSRAPASACAGKASTKSHITTVRHKQRTARTLAEGRDPRRAGRKPLVRAGHAPQSRAVLTSRRHP